MDVPLCLFGQLNNFLPVCIFLCGPSLTAQRTLAAGFRDTGIEKAAAKSASAGKNKIRPISVNLRNLRLKNSCNSWQN